MQVWGTDRAMSAREARGAVGASLLAGLVLAVAWLAGAAAVVAPERALRQAAYHESQRWNAGEALRVAAPPKGPAATDATRAVRHGVVRVTGTGCGPRVSGSGWVVRPEVVVTNAHVVAGQDDPGVVTADGEELAAVPVHYEPRNDIAVLRVEGLAEPALRLARRTAPGTAAATLGYPESGPFRSLPARLDRTREVESRDSYGRGPITRRITFFRGETRPGVSGAPVVDGGGRVLATAFGSQIGRGPRLGVGVPNAVVSRASNRAGATAVSTGRCATP